MSGPNEFERSGKTSRTPVKTLTQEPNEAIGIKVFQDLMLDMKDRIVIELSSKLNENSKLVQEAVKSQQVFEQKSNKKFTELDYEKRRKNLIIKGLSESETDQDELEKMVIDLIKNELQVEIGEGDIDNVSRMGKDPIVGKSRPVLLRLLAEKRKKKILENKNKLKGSEIFIEPDLSKEKLAQNYEQRSKKRETSKKSKKVDKNKRRRSAEDSNGHLNNKILKEAGDSSLESSDEEIRLIEQKAHQA